MSNVRLTVGQAVVRFLSAQFSERDGQQQRAVPGMFGIFGHGNALGIGQALHEYGQELPFWQPKNEQSMVHTAAGFAKATRRLATLACTSSIGPGATNLVTGAATATVNRLPVLLLPGDTFANRRQGPVLQQLEHAHADVTVNDCLRPVSRFFDRVSRPEQLLTALPEAMRVLLDPAETGAVTIALHQDVQGESYDFPDELFERRVWRVSRRPPADDELRAAVAVLRQARRPLVIVGGGVRYSAAEDTVVRFANRHGIPVAETSAALGCLDGLDLALGGIGVNGTAAANLVAASADVVLHVGTRLSDFTTGSHSLFADPGVRFVGVNVASVDAFKLGAVPVQADARLALEALDGALTSVGWSTAGDYLAEVHGWLDDWSGEIAAATSTAEPAADGSWIEGAYLRLLNDAAEGGDWVVGAAGATPGDLLKTWQARTGVRTHDEFGYSCMGHEIPAAMGIRLADEAAGEVYALVGDGTYLMANTELVTAVQHGIKVTVVIFANGGYQSIQGLQRMAMGRTFGNEFRSRDGVEHGLTGSMVDVDYETNAASLGCATWVADSPQEFVAALREARAEMRSSVIVVPVSTERALPANGAFWDLGVPTTSSDAVVNEAATAHLDRASAQRAYL